MNELPPACTLFRKCRFEFVCRTMRYFRRFLSEPGIVAYRGMIFVHKRRTDLDLVTYRRMICACKCRTSLDILVYQAGFPHLYARLSPAKTSASGSYLLSVCFHAPWFFFFVWSRGVQLFGWRTTSPACLSFMR
jgi:hypothetical protein